MAAIPEARSYHTPCFNLSVEDWGDTSAHSRNGKGKEKRPRVVKPPKPKIKIVSLEGCEEPVYKRSPEERESLDMIKEVVGGLDWVEAVWETRPHSTGTTVGWLDHQGVDLVVHFSPDVWKVLGVEMVSMQAKSSLGGLKAFINYALRKSRGNGNGNGNKEFIENIREFPLVVLHTVGSSVDANSEVVRFPSSPQYLLGQFLVQLVGVAMYHNPDLFTDKDRFGTVLLDLVAELSYPDCDLPDDEIFIELYKILSNRELEEGISINDLVRTQTPKPENNSV